MNSVDIQTLQCAVVSLRAFTTMACWRVIVLFERIIPWYKICVVQICWGLFESTEFFTISLLLKLFKVTLFKLEFKWSNTMAAREKYFSMLSTSGKHSSLFPTFILLDSPQIAMPVYSEKHLHWNYSTSWGLNKIKSPQNNNRKRAIFYNRCV